MRRAAVVAALFLAVLVGGAAIMLRASSTTNDARAAAGEQPFGFNSSLFYEGDASAVREATFAARAGAQLHRMPISWRGMQAGPKRPPLPDEGGRPPGQLSDPGSTLGEVDDGYLALTSRGIRPIIIVWDAPVWATRYAYCADRPITFGGCRATGEHLVPDAAHMPAWKRFVAAVTARYPQAIIETWNEPNAHWGSTPAAPSPEEMAATACAAHAAVKSVDPQRIVLSPGLADRRMDDYLGRMYDAGAGKCWDAYSVHMYFGRSTHFEQDLETRLQDLRALRGSHGDHTQMWITEAGWTTSGWFGVTPLQQADAITRLRARLALQPDVAAVILHTLRDAPGPLYRTTSSPEYGYGVLRSDWTPKPAYTQLSSGG